MSGKSLKEYLSKAEYLLVMLKNHKQDIKSPSPIKNVKRAVSPAYIPPSILKPWGCHPSNPVSINRLLRLSTVKVSLIEESPSRPKSLLSVKKANKVGHQQNLHLLSYSVAYHANHKRDTPHRWQKVNQFNAQGCLNSLLRAKTTSLSLNNKIAKISNSSSGTLVRKSPVDDDRMALEKEFSHRRNYRTSRPLHT